MNHVLPDYQRFITPDTTMPGFMQFVYREWSGRVNPFERGSVEWQEFRDYVARNHNERNQQWENLPDVPVVRLPSKRRMPQPTLKIPFSTIHDISLRLRHTLVFVGSELYYVTEVVQLRNDFLLAVQNKAGEAYKVWYSSPDLDLRSLEPQYITYEGRPWFVYRLPLRVQKQGMSADTLYCRSPGGQPQRLRNLRCVQEGLSTDVFPWNPMLQELMAKVKALPSIRLSKNVAAYLADPNTVMADYRGRPLGPINENTITVDDMDIKKPWITAAIQQIGCRPRQET